MALLTIAIVSYTNKLSDDLFSHCVLTERKQITNLFMAVPWCRCWNRTLVAVISVDLFSTEAYYKRLHPLI